MSARQYVLVLLTVLIAGCGQEPDPLMQVPGQRQYDTDVLLKGEKIYNRNCVVCHQAGGTGDSLWREPGDDARFRPPPLNGTGHTWHHPLAQIRSTIREGGPQGQSNMPGWSEILTEDEINATIIWFQAMWPEQVYTDWYAIQSRVQKSKK